MGMLSLYHPSAAVAVITKFVRASLASVLLLVAFGNES